jgi:hypothetical protein
MSIVYSLFGVFAVAGRCDIGAILANGTSNVSTTKVSISCSLGEGYIVLCVATPGGELALAVGECNRGVCERLSDCRCPVSVPG